MAMEREPPSKPSGTNARLHDKPSQILDIARQQRASRAHEIMLSPQLQRLSQSEINALVEDLRDDLTWNEMKEIGMHYRKMKPAAPVRVNMIGMENESYCCPEMLPKARGGPGVEPQSKIYQKLAEPRYWPGIEQPEPWSISDPPEVIPDEGYPHEKLAKPVWSEHKIDTKRFRSRWKDENLFQLMAYATSDPVFPVIQDGKLTLTSKRHKTVYSPKPTSWDNCDLVIQEGTDWDDYLLEHKISSFVTANDVVRKQFIRWMDQIPDSGVVNIFRTAFFNGTAMPDGISSMFIPDLKHLPTPRNPKEELTRLHWHETSEGYAYNWSPGNQKRIRAEEDRKEDLRRTAPLRKWLSRPRGSKALPPRIYLRPAELCDCPWVLDIWNWYVEHSASSEYTKPWDEDDYAKLYHFCRDNKLPFVISAQRPDVRMIKNQVDPAVGYAFVEYHGHNKRAVSQVGELHVFVHREYRKQNIGWALVDMVLSCFDTSHIKNDDYPIDYDSTVQYGKGYGRHLTSLVCPLAYHSEKQRKTCWVKKWLQKDFEFHEQSVSKSARSKFDSKYVFSFLFRPFIH
jgi:GNAT superfamily N-acetyltransferase